MGNMETVFLRLLNISISACWLILAVVLLRLVLKKAPKWSRCVMWAVAALRLVCPFSIESALSLIPSAETVPMDIIYIKPEIQSGVPVIDEMVNPVIPEALAPNPLGSINPMQVVLAVAACVWVVGMVAMLIYMTISFLRMRRRVSEAIPIEGNVYFCDRVESPFILGIFRPRIYLPSTIKEEDIPHVLSHERAHLKRRDHWWKPLGFLILTVHWFNPLVWVAYVLLCRDIEFACDERVIRDLGTEEKKPYSNALINCAAERKSIAACPLAFGEVGVKGRIKSVLNYKKPMFWVVWIAVVVCIVLSVCFLTNPKTMDPGLKVFLEEKIAEHHQSSYHSNDLYCVDFEVLGTKEDGKQTTVYLCVYYVEYNPETGMPEGGSHGPEVLTAENIDGEYRLTEYWNPKDGSEYSPSIREKFPLYLWVKTLDTQTCLKEHQERCGEQLQQYQEKDAQLAELRERYPQYFDLDSSRGLDVYVWQMAANSYYFALFPHTDIPRHLSSVHNDMSELIFAKGIRMEEMRLILSSYDVAEEEIDVIPWQNPISSYIGDYWIIIEGEDMQTKREKYTAWVRKMLFGDSAEDKFTGGGADLTVWTPTPEKDMAFYSEAVIDLATADMDADGVDEVWCMSYGPTSGLYTISISMAEQGKREYFNLVMPSYIVEGFEKTQDGTLWIRGKGAEHGPSPRIDIRIEDSNIVLIENGNERVPYWGVQGVESPYNIG